MANGIVHEKILMHIIAVSVDKNICCENNFLEIDSLTAN